MVPVLEASQQKQAWKGDRNGIKSVSVANHARRLVYLVVTVTSARATLHAG